jgi:UDP-N-acetylglucosamine/UDP-N-acetylgalactosamine diphosphorylase
LPSAEDLRQRFADLGQGHVFRFWEELDPQGRERLAQQAASIDLPALLDAFAALGGAQRQPPKLEPIAVEAAAESGGEARRWAKARTRSEALLAEGRVAVMVVGVRSRVAPSSSSRRSRSDACARAAASRSPGT